MREKSDRFARLKVEQYILLMARNLDSQFRLAAKRATASLGDVAKGMGRGYRMLHAYLRKERNVTPDAARGLIKYLRSRAQQLSRAADELEAVLEEPSAKEDTDV